MFEFFKVFSKSKIDKDILDLYELIQIEIETIDDTIKILMANLRKLKKYNNIAHKKIYYKVMQIYDFFNEINRVYKKCYDFRKNKKFVDFTKSVKTDIEKKKIIIYLKQILLILQKIEELVGIINKKGLLNSEKEINELTDYINNVKRKRRFLSQINEDEKQRVNKIINEIKKEAINNEKHRIYAIDNYGNKQLFSMNLKKRDIDYLNLLSFLNLNNIERDDFLLRGLHKDDTFDVYHFNLVINDRKFGRMNIHVFPKELKHKLKRYIRKI